MLTFFQAIILGIVEGLTEFLPVSSTGHLIITSALLKIPVTEFLKTFQIAIQLGAIGAVLAIYGRKILAGRALILKLIVAFLPTGIIGLAAYRFVKEYLLGNTMVVAGALVVGGVLLIVFERWHKTREISDQPVQEITYTHAFVIGMFQALAIIPGVSRAAATILGGLWLGYSRGRIVEFSFLLAIPTLAAATGWDLLKVAPDFSSSQFLVLGVGAVTAFLTAFVAIKWFLRFIEQHRFTAFGVYRIIAGVIVALFLR